MQNKVHLINMTYTVCDEKCTEVDGTGDPKKDQFNKMCKITKRKRNVKTQTFLTICEQ